MLIAAACILSRTFASVASADDGREYTRLQLGSVKYQRVYAKHKHAAFLGFRVRPAEEILSGVNCALSAYAAVTSAPAKAKPCSVTSVL